MENIKQLEKEIEELENKSWFRCDVKYTKELWSRLQTKLQTLKDILKLIDEDLKEANEEFDERRPFCWKDLSEEKKVEWTKILTKKKILEGLKETVGGS